MVSMDVETTTQQSTQALGVSLKRLRSIKNQKALAVGDYMSERLEIKASSATAALKHWQDAARYKGNNG